MKTSFLTLVLCAMALTAIAQNVAINASGASAHPDAILDISSTDKGILIPRMTTEEREAILTPPQGMLVFDITARSFWFFDSEWIKIIDTGNMGPASGDLEGQYPAPTVTKIQGRPIAPLGPDDKQVLKWDASSGAWRALNDSLTLPFIGEGSGSVHAFSVKNTFNGFTINTAIHGERLAPSGISMPTWSAIWGDANVGTGVLGTSNAHPGIYGQSLQSNGIEGYASGMTKAGVFGFNGTEFGVGVRGYAPLGNGMDGKTDDPWSAGMYGHSTAAEHSIGVKGEAQITDVTGSGVYGISYASDEQYGGVVGWNGKPGGIGINGRAPFGIGVNGFTQSANYPAVRGVNTSGGKGVYGYSGVFGSESLIPIGVHGRVQHDADTGYAMLAQNEGNGDGVRSFTGNGGSAFSGFDASGYIGHCGRFETTVSGNFYPTVFIRNAGTGSSLFVDVTNTTVSHPALIVHNSSTQNDYAIFEDGGGANKIRFDNTGKGFFNGGTQTGGADIAEVFDVENDIAYYTPGDVLVISLEKDRTVTKSAEPYSSLVAGVYATKPGVLMTEESIDADLSGKVPMGVIGVIPTKVCLEGGSINRGDLLVTSSIPGIAMKGDPDKVRPGQLIGKALEPYTGNSEGLIRVLVNVR